MKILFVITSLEGLGGTERVTTVLANDLANYYEVSIFSGGLKPSAYNISDKVNDIRTTGGIIKFRLNLSKTISEISPDVVVIHTMSKLTPYLLLTGIKANSLWSYEHVSYEFHSKLYKYFRKVLYHKLDSTLVFTDGQKKIFKKFTKNVNIIKNPTSLTISSKPYDKSLKNIISIGRLTTQKGYDMLVESWSLIGYKYPDWQLDIYGEGEDKAILSEKIKSLDVNNIQLKGNTQDIAKIYDNAAFYVMSSRYEGLPMVLLEAQSTGVPVISFNCPTGPEEVINHNINGILVPANDINKLSEEMERLINDFDLREKLSFNSKIKAKDFSIDSIRKIWMELIDEVN